MSDKLKVTLELTDEKGNRYGGAIIYPQEQLEAFKGEIGSLLTRAYKELKKQTAQYKQWHKEHEQPIKDWMGSKVAQ